MRRMLLPEVKIKSKLKNDILSIELQELLTHGYINNPSEPNVKSVIIQAVEQQAGDKDDYDGGIYVYENNPTNEITNSILTITIDLDYIYINGLGINIVIDLSVTPLEDIDIVAPYDFDVYIINP